MPTPNEIAKMRRNAALAQQGDFYVHEVVECVSSDDENCGNASLRSRDRLSAWDARE